MIRFLAVALSVILFLIFSIPLLVAEWVIGRKNPNKKNWQSLHIVQAVFRFLLLLAGVRITVKGKEHIPEDTAVLYVGNHRSYFDILVGYVTVPGLVGFDEECKLPVFGQKKHERRSENDFTGYRAGQIRYLCLDFPGRDQGEGGE